MVSATDQMRQQLAELMGSAAMDADDGPGLQFYDDKVCKSFLLNCCPHDILHSTRHDIGQCSRVHNLALRADYENAMRRGKDYFYEQDAMEHLERFINECDKRTEQAKKRLAEQQEDLTLEQTSKVNAIHEMAERIGKKLAEAESMGEAGDVEGSMNLFKQVEELKTEKRQLEDDYKNTMPASTFQQQKLRVCEVCSAYLGIYDNDRRLADHFGGKLHLGFIIIRDKLEELRLAVTAKRNFRDTDRQKMGAAGREAPPVVRESGEVDSPPPPLPEDEERRGYRRDRRGLSREPSADRGSRSRSRGDSRRRHRRRSRSRSAGRSSRRSRRSRSRDSHGRRRRRRHSSDSD